MIDKFFSSPRQVVARCSAVLRQNLARMRSDSSAGGFAATAPLIAHEYKRAFFLGGCERAAQDWCQGQPLDRMLFAVNDNGHSADDAAASRYSLGREGSYTRPQLRVVGN